MLYTIGRRGPAAPGGGLSEMLLACHGRIRSFLALAVRVSEHPDTPRAEVVEVCQRVERYFEEALPLHVRDEEESLLPRLRGRSPAIDAALAEMHDEHVAHGLAVDALLARSKALRDAPEDASARADLLAAARQLESVFEPHLRREEEILFPAIELHLSTDERDAMLRELSDRRG